MSHRRITVKAGDWLISMLLSIHKVCVWAQINLCAMYKLLVQRYRNGVVKPVSHQPCGSRAPVRVDKFLDFVLRPHGVVYYTARLPYEKQGRKAAATNFRHVHFLCDLLAFSERCRTAARHTRLPQGCRKTAARHARCSYDWRYSSPATHLSYVSRKTSSR